MPFVKKKINEINLRTYLYRYKRNNDLRFLGQKIITSKIAEKGKTLKNQFLSRHELFKDIQENVFYCPLHKMACNFKDLQCHLSKKNK